MIKLTVAFHLLPFCFQKSCHNRGQLLVLNCGVAEPGFLPVAGANFDILQPLIKLLRLQTKKCWAESRSRMDFNIAMVRSRPKKDQLRNTANQWHIQALFNISFITCIKSLKNIFMGYLDSSHLYETVSWDFWPPVFCCHQSILVWCPYYWAEIFVQIAAADLQRYSTYLLCSSALNAVGPDRSNFW